MNKNENNEPEFLYHYTSIETLALILKNRTIRFNSLDKMDDLQEKEAKDIKNIGQFIYVSAWTSEQMESIPMWNMYASLKAGVRIRLKSNPFFLYDNSIQELQNMKIIQIDDGNQGKKLQSYIPISEMLEKGFISYQALSGIDLHRIEYTQDKDKLYPTILKIDENQFTIAVNKMGKYKNTHWEFQNEWRYILQVLPLSLDQNGELHFQSFNESMRKIIKGTEKQPFPYYDMKIDDAVFESMEITTSPKLSLGNRIILEALVSKYNPAALIHESSLQNLI